MTTAMSVSGSVGLSVAVGSTLPGGRTPAAPKETSGAAGIIVRPLGRTGGAAAIHGTPLAKEDRGGPVLRCAEVRALCRPLPRCGGTDYRHIAGMAPPGFAALRPRLHGRNGNLDGGIGQTLSWADPDTFRGHPAAPSGIGRRGRWFESNHRRLWPTRGFAVTIRPPPTQLAV